MLDAHNEAQVTARELIARGIAPDRLLLEPQATTTVGNAAYTIEMLRKAMPAVLEDGTTMTVVTEPFHAVRSLRAFAAALERDGHAPGLWLAATERTRTTPTSHAPRNARDGAGSPPRFGLAAEEVDRLTICIEEKQRIACGW